MKMNNRPLTIALFDSGVGGLSMLHPLLLSLPARYIYFSDTAFLPYGNKNTEQLQERCRQICLFLQEQGADIIISACHTLSTCALPLVRAEFSDTTFISSSDLIIKALCLDSKTQTVGIIGTEATIKSHYFKTHLMAKRPQGVYLERGCPLLASWIEEKRSDIDLMQLIELYIEPIKRAGADALIIGCTHYAHVQSLIKKYLGKHVRLLSAEEFIVDAVKQELQNKEIVFEKSVTFYSSAFERLPLEHFVQYLPVGLDYQYLSYGSTIASIP